VIRMLVGFVVRHVGTCPALSAFIPINQRTLRIEWFTGYISRGTVVQNAAVSRPCPRPVQRLTNTCRVAVITASHLVTFFGPATGVDPATRTGGSIGSQLTKTRELLIALTRNVQRVIWIT